MPRRPGRCPAGRRVSTVAATKRALAACGSEGPPPPRSPRPTLLEAAPPRRSEEGRGGLLGPGGLRLLRCARERQRPRRRPSWRGLPISGPQRLRPRKPERRARPAEPRWTRASE
eukprot:7533450-Alexandrium_andersonii.AAC.1